MQVVPNAILFFRRKI